MAIKTQPIIQLHHENTHGKVLVETDEQDRFVLTVSAAIEACQAYGKVNEFNQQFKELSARLSNWIGEHATDISQAYLTVRDASILFLVVQRAESFHQGLVDSLADLDVGIAQDEALYLIRLNVLALPRASEPSIESFLVHGGA
ncbi:MAG: hypothetical protein L0Y72_20085 [Gemmataceae bacterium]|nr:hypothetical protein [Gemmataceae bacterium]MCI0741337.1 hypothetical protein [Gemmataceae bacterium]